MTVKKKVTKKSSNVGEKLNNIYSTLIDRIEKVENFTLEHAPDVCKELVARKTTNYQNQAIRDGLASITALGIALSCYFLLIYGIELKASGQYSNEIVCILSSIGLVLAFMATVINAHCTLSSLLELREIKVSQKLIVLEGLKRLIKR